MQIKVFSVSIFDEGVQTEEMNKFLRSHAIIDVEKHLVDTLQNPVWTFCIRYKENSKKFYPAKPKVDYREVLDDDTFKIFSSLRVFRKQIAEKMGVPVFAVFTNEELANIAKLDTINIESLNKIEGIGKKRIEKYGASIMEMFNSGK